jgi:hypothetical protein
MSFKLREHITLENLIEKLIERRILVEKLTNENNNLKEELNKCLKARPLPLV